MIFCIALVAANPAAAQKKGGTLRLYHNDNPPSTSLLEESTIASVMPFAAVFNNLVTFDPAKVHESIETVIPDLAESWAWDQTNTKLTFKLRQGVKWHDGQPFTAKDVQCTWRMLIGKAETQDFKRNPRKVWYTKLKDVSINGDFEATFELSEPQPSLPVLLASAFSAVYPCHDPRDHVEGDQPLLGFGVAIDGKGDADAAEQQFRLLATILKGVRRGLLQPAGELKIGRTEVAAGPVHFIEGCCHKSRMSPEATFPQCMT